MNKLFLLDMICDGPGILCNYCQYIKNCHMLIPGADCMGPPIENKSEPKNNNGRKKCYWCNSHTIKKQLLTSNYDECPSCKK